EALAGSRTAPSDPQQLLETFLVTNVPSPSELHLGYWDGRPQKIGAGSAHRELADPPGPEPPAPELTSAVDGLLPAGGSTEIDTAFGPASVVVKPVRSDV